MKFNLILVILSVFTLLACQKSEDTVALTPTSLNCGNSNNCNGQVYQQNGFQPYNQYQNPYNNPNSFCGCPIGFRPVYNSSWGMGCVSNQVLYPHTTGTYTTFVGWTWVAGSGWLNIPQTPYESGTPNTNPYNNSCHNQVIATCDTTQANTCGAGNICRPIGGGSLIGTCVKETF